MTVADTLWSPFDPTNAIGDAGRQPEIRSVSGDLNVGVADTALDFLTVGPMELRACSSRGWSHRYKGTPRQDAYCVLVGEEVVVIAVADGVSEGEHSQVAADTAARAAVKLVADHVSRTGVVDWVQLARRVALRIVEEGEYRQIVAGPAADADINERVTACRAKMSTTLIVAVVQRHPTHEGFATEIGVVAGDSAAYRLTVDDDVLMPVGGGKAQGGPISSTSVHPLPGPVTPATSTVLLRPGELLVLGTDGIGDPIGDGTNDFGRELAHRWREPPPIHEFLLDVNVYRRSFDDDRTAVGIWVRPGVELPDPPESMELVTDGKAGPDGAVAYEPPLTDANETSEPSINADDGGPVLAISPTKST